MTNVRFIYQGSDKVQEREIVAEKICDFLRNHIDLPKSIEVMFSSLDESVYGVTHVNPRFKNRIIINNSLTFNEIPQVIVHELIHLSQIKAGKLSSTSNGLFVWENKIYDLQLYPNYDELPWEVDVAKKQRDLLIKTYEFFAPKT